MSRDLFASGEKWNGATDLYEVSAPRFRIRRSDRGISRLTINSPRTKRTEVNYAAKMSWVGNILGRKRYFRLDKWYLTWFGLAAASMLGCPTVPLLAMWLGRAVDLNRWQMVANQTLDHYSVDRMMCRFFDPIPTLVLAKGPPSWSSSVLARLNAVLGFSQTDSQKKISSNSLA